MAKLSVYVVMCYRLVLSYEAPVVDMERWRIGDEIDRDVIAHQVATAAKSFGFFYVRNHGIPDNVTASAVEAMRTFFALPDEYKYEVEADKSRSMKTARGYINVGDEQLDLSGWPDLKEVLDIGLPLGERTSTYLGPNPWPSALPHFRNATEPNFKATFGVGMELLAAVARSVGLPDDGFADIFDEPLVIQRLMRYRTKVNDSNTDVADLGCGAHYDFGGLTLIRQFDAPGLQVMPPAHHGSVGQRVTVEKAPYSTVNGTFYAELHNDHVDEWVPVNLDPDLLIVGFGEALQRMTNGKVQATRHRVVHDGSSERHTIAVFLDPNPHKEVTPMLELADGQPKYAPRIAGHKTMLLAAAAAIQQRLGKGYLGYNVV